MTAYEEAYNIFGVVYGIEDHADGKPAHQHFFHRDFLEGKAKQFRLWRGGSGFGQADKLDDAREQLIHCVRLDAVSKKAAAIEALAESNRVLDELSTYPLTLSTFKVKP
jgi:hypothetical protein